MNNFLVIRLIYTLYFLLFALEYACFACISDFPFIRITFFLLGVVYFLLIAFKIFSYTEILMLGCVVC